MAHPHDAPTNRQQPQHYNEHLGHVQNDNSIRGEAVEQRHAHQARDLLRLIPDPCLIESVSRSFRSSGVVMSRQSSMSLTDRFVGCFLGQAIGDAVGSPLEGLPPDLIYTSWGSADDILNAPDEQLLCYTDDTQMMLGVAEALLADGRIVEETLIHRFAANFRMQRRYGIGVIRILEAVRLGGDWRLLATSMFPGGSYGNGAAMRVAPVGLFSHQDLDRVWEEARRSSQPTHQHPLGIEGAQLLAVAVALLVRESPFHRDRFYEELRSRATLDEYRWLLDSAACLSPDDTVSILGNGIEAHRSVVTSIACFALSPNSYEEAVGRAITLGGDTDTLAAMTGALSGTYLGIGGIPARLIERLEDDEMGRNAIQTLAARRCAVSLQSTSQTTR